jgi:hypothetical protein
MKPVAPNLADLKPNLEWASLPLLDRAGSVASFLSFVGFVQRSPGHLIQALHKQPSHDFKSNNRNPMDRGTYHRARGLFGCLAIARSTIDPAAPKGQKEIAQGRAKRRPGYIAHRYRFRLKAGGNRSATTGRSPWINDEKADLKLYHARLFAKQRCALNVPRQLRSHPPPV